MTAQDKPLWRLTPEEAASAHGMTVEELKENGRVVYLAADLRRHSQGYRDLWNRWARGKSNMPLAVETALDDPRSVDSSWTVLEYLGRETRPKPSPPRPEHDLAAEQEAYAHLEASA